MDLLRPQNNDIILHCPHLADDVLVRAHVFAVVEDDRLGGQFTVGGFPVFAKWVALCDDCNLRSAGDPISKVSGYGVFDGSIYRGEKNG